MRIKAQVATEYLLIYVVAFAGILLAIYTIGYYFPYVPPSSFSGFYNFNTQFYNFNGTYMTIGFSSQGFNFKIINFTADDLISYSCNSMYINASGEAICSLVFKKYIPDVLITMYYQVTNTSLGIVSTQARASV